MPNYDVHKKIGFIFSLVITVLFAIFFYRYFPLKGWQWWLLPLVIIVYSNAADYDHHMGKLRRNTLKLIFFTMLLSGIIAFFVNIKLMIAILMFTGLLGIGLLKVKHRGPLHTYWFVLLASLPLLYLHWFLFVTALGCSSLHIFIDRIYSGLKRWLKKVFHMKGETHVYKFQF